MGQFLFCFLSLCVTAAFMCGMQERCGFFCWAGRGGGRTLSCRYRSSSTRALRLRSCDERGGKGGDEIREQRLILFVVGTRGLHSLTSAARFEDLRDTTLMSELKLSVFGPHPRVDLGDMGDKVSSS
jgi:hypothetical protein